ncbi:MAG: hypothetical protein ACE5HX_08875 [bacterium]
MKKFVVVSVFSAMFTAIFITPFCSLMYRCGCTFLWAGAADYCNIYQAGRHHCPWCQSQNPFLISLPGLIIISGQLFSLYFFTRKWKLSYLKLIVFGVFSFLVFGAAVGYVYKWYFDYPHFFVK